MKSGLFSALLALLLMLFINVSTQAQTSNLIMSKHALGTISQIGFSMNLTTDSGDQTQSIVPDGSRIVATNFLMTLDSNGIGTFQGIVVLILPNRAVLLTGTIQGTVGVTTNIKDDITGSLPNHIQGMVIFPNTTNPSLSLIANFAADILVEAGSPLTVFQGHMDGVMTTSPKIRRTFLKLQ